MSAFAGEHSSGLVPGESLCHRRTHVSPDVTTGHMMPLTPSTVTLKEAREAGECGERKPCRAPKTKPQRQLARRGRNQLITEHKDDPEEDSPQSDNETAEEVGQLHDAES